MLRQSFGAFTLRRMITAMKCGQCGTEGEAEQIILEIDEEVQVHQGFCLRCRACGADTFDSETMELLLRLGYIEKTSSDTCLPS